VNALAGGWQISGITTFNQGSIFGAIAGSCNLPKAGTCYVDTNPAFSGPVRIGGDPASANLRSSTPPVFLNKSAFLNPAPYAYGTSPRTGIDGLRGANYFNQSLSLKREFALHESIKLVMQADVQNPTNFVIFGTPSVNFNSTNFGTITSTANSPRVVQFNARIAF
jgi:hypothetical protein